MKVALLCPYSLDKPGGVAEQVLGLASWLHSQGIQPSVIAPGQRHISAPFKVHLLGESVAMRFNGATAHLALRKQQVSAALTVARAADVVHVHEPLTPGIGYAVARAAQVLTVTHHAAYSARLARALRLRAARLPRRVALAVSVTAAHTAYHATGRWPRVVPNGITLPALSNIAREALVLFVGRRDDPRKGYGVFGKLARSLPHIRCVAIGPGKNSEPGVEELGEVDRHTKNRLLSQARVLVAPHWGGESFGMVLLEALAHGCAVVGHELPAFRDIVTDPAVATWVKPGDLAALRAAVMHRVDQPIPAKLARRVAEPYAWEVIGPRVEGAYRAALLGHDIG